MKLYAVGSIKFSTKQGFSKHFGNRENVGKQASFPPSFSSLSKEKVILHIFSLLLLSIAFCLVRSKISCLVVSITVLTFFQTTFCVM